MRNALTLIFLFSAALALAEKEPYCRFGSLAHEPAAVAVAGAEVQPAVFDRFLKDVKDAGSFGTDALTDSDVSLTKYRSKTTSCLLLTVDGKVAGYAIYDFAGRDSIDILKMAVAKDFQKTDAGSQLLRALDQKRADMKRSRLSVWVPETSVPAQVFFRENGFKATVVKPDGFDKPREDARRMDFQPSAGAGGPAYQGIVVPDGIVPRPGKLERLSPKQLDDLVEKLSSPPG